MDEVLKHALAVPNPEHFLEDANGIHEVEEIYLTPGGLRARTPHGRASIDAAAAPAPAAFGWRNLRLRGRVPAAILVGA